jgi:hypothetical protein
MRDLHYKRKGRQEVYSDGVVVRAGLRACAGAETCMRKVIVIGALALAGCHTWTPLGYQEFRYVGKLDPADRTATVTAEANPGEGAFLRDEAICMPPRGPYPGPWGYAMRDRDARRYFACMAEKGWVQVPDK